VSAATAAVAARRRRLRAIVAAFAGAGASSAAQARTPEELGLPLDGFRQRDALQRLRERGVLREAAPGRYWVDLEAWQALRGRRRWLLLAIALAALAFGVLAAWLPLGR
jgi:hypothetical protein